MQNLFSTSAPRTVSVLLRLTIRPAYWRIAIILPGRILWRTYRREAYPEPEAALRRCLEGLGAIARDDPEHDARPGYGGNVCQRIPHDSLHEQRGQKHHQHQRAKCRHQAHLAPPFWLPPPEDADQRHEDKGVHAEVQEGVKHPAPPAPSQAHQRPLRFRVAWWGWL